MESMKQNQTTQGFTLIETMVAIAILLLSVAGPLTIASQSLFVSRIAKNEIVASYLAQEITEFIRNQRDTNAINNRDWMTGLDSCIGDYGCTIDIGTGLISECLGACPDLRHDEATGRYGYTGGWDASVFRRTIFVSETEIDQEALVTVTVSWQDGFLKKEFTLDQTLLNWQ